MGGKGSGRPPKAKETQEKTKKTKSVPDPGNTPSPEPGGPDDTKSILKSLEKDPKFYKSQGESYKTRIEALEAKIDRILRLKKSKPKLSPKKESSFLDSFGEMIDG